MKAGACILLAAVLAATGAHAATPDYLDDRSSAAALVRSLYNAINRKEYARAYGYFATPPEPTLEDYAAGFDDTASVRIELGAVSQEGAAGSTYFNVPIAIEATAGDGGTSVFAGCYTLRLASPHAQAVPFTPLHIESSELGVAEAPLQEAVPAQCGDAPPPETDAALERAKAMFRATQAENCQSLDPNAEPGAAEPESHTIGFFRQDDAADAPERQTRLFRFWCFAGAYNEVHVYFFQNDDGDIRPLQFAVPELDIRYEGDDPEGAVEEIYLIGYRTTDTLVNSNYDADTRTIVAHALWRGIGDAATTGKWLFRSGEFSLIKYEVDASYDGEVNPRVVLDYDTGP